MNQIDRPKPIRSFLLDRTRVEIYENRRDLGRAAGLLAADKIRECLREQNEVRVVFAAAPSQNEMLETLVSAPNIDWKRVIGLHMDEYVGLPFNAPQRFSHYLFDHLIKWVPFKSFFYIDDPEINLDPEEIFRRYKRILGTDPIDVVCMGIGENGHIAFNDPPADFNDPSQIRIVDLDDVCRMQQVHDGCFPNIDSVPKQAISLTVPTLMAAKSLICSVPGKSKRKAVYRVINDKITPECPATILRDHPDSHLFIDTDSCDISNSID